MGKRLRNIKTYFYEYHIIWIILSLVALYLSFSCYDNHWLSHNNYSHLFMIKIVQPLSFILWGLVVAINFLTVFYRRHTERNFLLDTIKYRRGFKELFSYYREAEPHKRKLDTLPIKKWYESDGIILGKIGNRLVEVPPSAGKNCILFGIPKSGKTVSLIATCLQYAGSIFAIDIKGDLYKATAKCRKISLFSPSNPAGSKHYNPFEGISSLSIDERRKFLRTIGQMIIPEQNGDGQFFSDGAKTFWSGISLYLLSKNIQYSFPEIVEKILLGNPFDWVLTVKGSTCKEAQEFLNSLYGANEKNVSGMYDCLCNALRPYNTDSLKELLTDNGDCISADTLEYGYDIYIQVNQNELVIYSDLIRLITQQMIDRLMRRPDNTSGEIKRPILFVLDEFSQLKRMPDIQIMLATLRSKNVTAIIALQSREQLTKWYGESGASEIIDCCAVVCLIQIQDVSTRKWASDFIGKRKKLTISTSANDNFKSGRTTTETTEYVYQPEAWGDLGPFRIVVSDSGKYIEADIVKYFAD